MGQPPSKQGPADARPPARQLPRADPWLKMSQGWGGGNLNKQDSGADGRPCFEGAPCLALRALAPVPWPYLGCPALLAACGPSGSLARAGPGALSLAPPLLLSLPFSPLASDCSPGIC